MLIRSRKAWEMPEREATPESDYWNRRRFLRAAGFGLAGLASGGLMTPAGAEEATAPPEKNGAATEDGALPAGSSLYPAKRNKEYKLDRPLTPELNATSYNNFYEFSYTKDAVRFFARKLEPSPWSVEVTGAVAKPTKFDLDDLLRKVTLEERLYRFRCVEAWAMAVPWTGFPLSKLLDLVEPKSSAKYVRFLTFLKPEWAPNQRSQDWPWPYYEALTMAEARNELTLLATGLYGKPMPKQNGAPIRLVVPWKYGFKSIKSIVRIEVTEKQPATFWNTAAPNEYGFLANVNPKKPHPRWSQAQERMIDTGETRPTLPYNGYEELVAGMYKL
jgi:sulfoxide reductase catalytic subunit YedY